jgi:hypothetical protein
MKTIEDINELTFLVEDHLFKFDFKFDFEKEYSKFIHNINALITEYWGDYQIELFPVDFLQVLRNYIINSKYDNDLFFKIKEYLKTKNHNVFYYKLAVFIFDLPINVSYPFDIKTLSKLNLTNNPLSPKKASIMNQNDDMSKTKSETVSVLSRVKTKAKSHSIEIAKRTAAKKLAKKATQPVIAVLKALKIDNPFIYSMLETEQGAAFVGSVIGLAAPWLPIPNKKVKAVIDMLSDELQIQGGQAAFEPMLDMVLGPFVNEFSKSIESLMGQADIKQLLSSNDPIGDEIKKRTTKRKPKKVSKTTKQDEKILVKDVVTV